LLVCSLQVFDFLSFRATLAAAAKHADVA